MKAERPIKTWLRMGLSVALGNAIYFSSRPWLPFPYAHERFRLDPGLALDFLLCFGIYLLARRLWR